jgi:hypothetical protein
LNAPKRQSQQRSQRGHHQRFRQPGHALKDAMPAAQEDDEQLLDDVLQAHDDAADLADDGLVMLVELLDRLKFIGAGLDWRAGVHGFGNNNTPDWQKFQMEFC